MAEAQVEKATQPAAGPSKRSTRSVSSSRHHLEPNPFEQSFSSKPGHPDSPGATTAGSKSGTAGNNKDADAKHDKKEKTASPLDARDTPGKRLLPPIASITSPAHEGGSSYPWSGGLNGSLRAGPLSPAMLAGPQTSTFDASTFRTGFTPDLSNFKTGLTPLGGSSFPPPSPNTAAFLAMVTNAGSSLSGSTVTPNTLSALSGSASGIMADPAPGQTITTTAADAAPVNATSAFNMTLPTAMQRQRGASKNGSASVDTSVSPEMVQKPLEEADGNRKAPARGKKGAKAGGPSQQANQAASGLFLLSQAHRELAKREDAAAAAAAAAAAGGALEATAEGANAKAKAPAGAKRKRSPAPAAQPAKASGGNVSNGAGARKKGSKGASNVKVEKEESSEDEAGSSDEEGKEDHNGKDDEEKRRNFLERNRQAALKCRQRKKAWLQSLQAKVEYLQTDNENLQGTVSALRHEIMFLKSQLFQSQQQLATARGEPLPPAPPGLAGPPIAPPPPNGIPGMPLGGAPPPSTHPSQSPEHMTAPLANLGGPTGPVTMSAAPPMLGAAGVSVPPPMNGVPAGGPIPHPGLPATATSGAPSGTPYAPSSAVARPSHTPAHYAFGVTSGAAGGGGAAAGAAQGREGAKIGA